MDKTRCTKCKAKALFAGNLCSNCFHYPEDQAISKIESLVNTANMMLLELVTEDGLEKLFMHYDKSRVEDMDVSKKTKIINATNMHINRLIAIGKES